MMRDHALRVAPLLLLLPAAWLISAGYSRHSEQKPAAPCCFTHPGYTGVCEVKPGEGETCESILAYLNAPNSTGKGYCGGTSLRGGWKPVKCGAPDEPVQACGRQ